MPAEVPAPWATEPLANETTKEEEPECSIEEWEQWATGGHEDAKEEVDDEHWGDWRDAPEPASGAAPATHADAAAAEPGDADAAAADPGDANAAGADRADAPTAGADPADAHTAGADPAGAGGGVVLVEAAPDGHRAHGDPGPRPSPSHTWPWRQNEERWRGPIRGWKNRGKGNGKGQKNNSQKGNNQKGNQKGRGGKGRGGRGRNQSGTGKGAGGDHGGASSSTLALMSSWIVFQVAQHTHVNLKRVAIVIVPSVCAHWLSYISGSGHGAVAHAPKPWWAYRGEKRSSKAHPVGQEDQWGGRYVEGGYEIGGQVYPLLGSSYL